jgi:ABC-type long-subunit fatty acid transport system fused permease/ATPase subunit
MSFLYGKMGHNLFQKFCQNHEIIYVNKFYFGINEINYVFMISVFANLLMHP